MFYANWLDGEHIKISRKWYPTRWIEINPARHLKYHALIGDTICLSDVQLIDSWAITHTFNDEDFRRFIREHTEFLALVSRSDPSFKSRRYAIATSGLRRSLKKNWISSACPSSDSIKKLSEHLLKDEAVDPQAAIKRLEKGEYGHSIGEIQECGDILRGIIWGIHFFVNNNESVCNEATGSYRTYYQRLLEARDSELLIGSQREKTEKTIAFIESKVPGIGQDKDLQDRSRIHQLLDLELAGPEEHKEIWGTVVNSWNSALQSSLEADASISVLKHGSAVGVFQTNPVHWLEDKEGEPESDYVKFADRWHLDPLQFSWHLIAQVRNETSETCKELRLALESQDVLRKKNAMHNHLDAIAKVAEGKIPRSLTSLIWKFANIVAKTSGVPKQSGDLLNVGMFLEGCVRRAVLINALKKAAKR